MHVGHADWVVDGRAEDAARDMPDGVSVHVLNLFANPYWCTFCHEADPLALHELLVCDLATNDVGPDEVCLLAPPLPDGPQKTGLDRRRRFVDVVTVEAEAGLQTKAEERDGAG